jgi:hypothetical protein
VNEVNSKLKNQGMRSQKVSQRPLKSILSHFQIISRVILSSNQNKPLNEPNFITLGNLSEEEKIEIIQRGFQLNQQGKISLKKYYESTDTNSLFQAKGYSIKYESLRKNDLYKQLKPSNI